MDGDDGAAGHQTVISATPGAAVSVADAAFITHGDILRDGQDLILQAPDGSEVVIENYFAMDPAPAITGPGGVMLTPELVHSFVRGANQQYAANEQTNDESPIGAVQEVKGTATVTRLDGTVETITVGTVIFQGDVVETEGDGAVNIVFIDETSFAVSENAKMAIDEYVFDPSTESGTTNFSVLRGMFVFTSGLIGRDDPDDVEIDTPVGSIGIRGTTIAGNLNTGEITVIEGAIVLRTHDGQEVTLATQFETGRFNAANGTVEVVGVLDGQTVSLTFAGMGPVVPAFFAAIGITPTEDTSGNPAGPGGNNDSNTNPDAIPGDTTGAETQDQGAVTPEPQPLNADLSTDVAGTSDPFAQTSTFDSAAGTTDTTTASGGSGAAGTAPLTTSSPAGLTTTTTQTTAATTDSSVTTPPPPVTTVTPPPPNNFAPTLTASATFTMPENSALNTAVTGILGTDADGNALSYSLTGGGGLFAINNGVIVINGVVDFEAATTHSLTVMVTDGVFTATETYTINITDANDPSVFTSATSIAVAENATAGTTLYTAVATDQDAGAISYSLGGAPGAFAINATTGIVTSAVVDIDYETVGGSITFDVIATQGGLSTTHTITLNITNIDDTAPVVAVNNGAVTEGATLVLTAAMLQATDVDTAGAANLTYTVSAPSAGQVHVSGAPSTTFTQADVDAGIVTFVHDGSNGATANFSFTVSDGINVTGLQGFSMTVAQVNNAPVLNAAAPTLTATVEDTTSGSNNIGTLMSGTVTDDETATGSIGMAITAADSTNGTWQYYDTVGAAWTDFPLVTGASALLLLPADVIRFIPAADYNGTATISYKAWDGSAGTRYGTADTGAGTAFSAATNVASMTVSAVNDAPVIDLDTLSGSANRVANFTEGTPIFIVDGNISIADPDSTIASVTVSIATPPNGLHEKLIYDGTAQFLTDRGISLTGDETDTLTINGSGATTAAQFAEVLQRIRYNNFHDNMTDGTRTINISAYDGTLTSAVRAVTVNVTSVSDNDVFLGSVNDDTFVGDGGDDMVYVTAGEDNLDGGAGIDTLNFSNATGQANISLTSGNLLDAGFGAANYYIANFENVVGTDYDDNISGNTFNNILEGGAGNDVITGGGGADILWGGDGNDVFGINPTDGDLTIDGGNDNDTYNAATITGTITLELATGDINRGAWVDNVTSIESFILGSGNDYTKVTTGVFDVDGGAGSDTLDFSALGAGITFDVNVTNFNYAGADLAQTGFENAVGTAYDDTFIGNAANNRFEGGGGDDMFRGSGGNNEYVGGAAVNFDTVDYLGAGGGIIVDLEAGTASNNGRGGADILSGIERVIGTDYNDTIKGKAGVTDTLIGGLGDDTLIAQGDDNVSGGTGNDTIRIGPSFVGMDINGGADTDTLALQVAGTYNLNDLSSLNGIEIIDAQTAAINATMSLNVSASMLSSMTGTLLTINMDAGDTLLLDLSAFAGGDAFSLQSTAAGTVSYYSAGLGNTITINHAGGYSVTGDVALGAGLSLNSIAAADGYVMTDNLGKGFGYALTSHAGDLDGDGFDDFIVTRAMEENASQVALFTVNGSAAQGGNTTLAGAGVRVTPYANLLPEGGSANNAVIASIRDWDGDGVQDFIVGAYGGNSSDGVGGTATASGAVYVVNGVDGTILTELTDVISNEQLGRSVSGAGDVNGDGYADFIVGSPLATVGGQPDAGKAYLIFGGPNVSPTIALNSSTPSEVLVIEGVAADSQLGRNVQGLGDFNNDGFEDFAISEADISGIGRVHVVFGSATPSVTLGTSTFTINGVDMGASGEDIPLFAMGDINGDGIADLGVGSGLYSDSGALHLFFGGAHGVGTASIGSNNATITTGSTAVKIIGAGAVGDFNGDGIDDFGIAMMGTGSSVIDMYVVYGGSLTGVLDQSYLNNTTNAFRMSYTVPAGTNTSELDVTMSAIGDVNGDGLADVGIGIANIDNNLGFDSNPDSIPDNDSDGMVAVVYGSNIAGNTAVAAGSVSSASDQTLLGTSGNDTLTQSLGTHTGLVFRSGGGDDSIGISASSMSSIADIDGGAGVDTLEFLGSSQVLNFNGVTAENFKGIDEIAFGSVDTNQTMMLTIQQIFTMIESSDSQNLIIAGNGDIGSLLQIDDGAGTAPGTINTAASLATALGMTANGNDGTYYSFYQGDNLLRIDMNLIDNGQVQVT